MRFHALLTPFPSVGNACQQRFNTSLRSTRVAIECVFGQLKRRFGILQHGEIRMKSDRATEITGLCHVA